MMGVSVLISIFSATNFYIFFRVDGWLSLELGWIFYASGILLGCAAFIFIIWHPLPSKLLYLAAASWFGFIFVGFFIFLLGDLAARIVPVNTGYLAVSALLMTIIISIYAIGNHLSGRRLINIELRSSKIKNPLRLVLISDTHISGFHRADYLEGIVREINSQKPDIVCIGGDFADGETHFSAIAPLNKIIAPVYLVMGNHEVWNNHDGKIERLLSRTKATILNRSTHKGLLLIGVHFQTKGHGLKEGLQNFICNDEAYRILLYHEPKGVEAAQAAGIDLMLCGHTHGGQLFPWNYLTRLSYKYMQGLYEFKGMQIYVSQGTGVWGPPMRLGSKNEITVIDLIPEHAET
jgi:uncharacterized protein